MQDYRLQTLEWDTRFFGHAIARLALPAGEVRPEAVLAQLAQAWSQGLACVYLELPFQGPELVALGQRPGFHLVDLKTTLAADPSALAGADPPAEIASRALPAWAAALDPIVLDLARLSRYAFDPRFGPEQARRLYREWLRVALAGEFCSDILAWLEAGVPRGFLTLRRRGGVPHIDLVGVAADCRGHGVGGHLLRAAAARLARAGERHWRVVTQGHHAAALRFYERLGFTVASVALFYHVWLDELAGRP
jgi:ribosomal protein S18 acetylase RimI-like enzyme